MKYIMNEISFPSADGSHTIFGRIYMPENGEIKGVVQLSHGMIDHTGRYEALAEYLACCGYVFAGNDHLGHGRSVGEAESDFGYFADKGGIELLLSDLYTMNKLLSERFPGLPIILFGHSMGSFLSRLYVEKHPFTVAGHIIHGTGGPHKVILPMGKALTKFVSLFRGKRYRSKFIAGLAFSGYNSKFPKSEGKYAWLTRDVERVNHRDEDKYTSFIFTDVGYYDLFTMLGRCNSKKWFSSYPKSVATLILSGDMDPVGQYGKGTAYVYKHLLVSGCTSVNMKLYPGARHELFNETCRDEVFGDIVSWLQQFAK